MCFFTIIYRQSNKCFSFTTLAYVFLEAKNAKYISRYSGSYILLWKLNFFTINIVIFPLLVILVITECKRKGEEKNYMLSLALQLADWGKTFWYITVFVEGLDEAEMLTLKNFRLLNCYPLRLIIWGLCIMTNFWSISYLQVQGLFIMNYRYLKVFLS